MNRFLPAAFVLSLVLAPSLASACEPSERLRLVDEIESLVKKNAWTGVERKYNELLDMKCELGAETHNFAAQAARTLGKTWEMVQRLEAADAIEANDEVKQNLTGIENTYGRVAIRGSARKRAALIREALPFAPDQRKSIEYAQSVMAGTGSFKGMLPAGEYKVGEQVFTVEGNTKEFQQILVGKAKPVKDGEEDVRERPDRDDAGLIAWSGPVAMVGGGLWGSAAPKSQLFSEDNDRYNALPLVYDYSTQPPTANCGEDLPAGTTSERYRGSGVGDPDAYCLYTDRQPGDIPLGSTPVIDITLGYEIGLTYTAPELGVVALANYRRTPGRRFNQLTFMAGPVIRPGIFRATAGATWGLVFGSTLDHVEWTNEAQYEVDLNDANQVPGMSGYAFGGGLAGSFGAALLDLGPFEGTIEAHGHWMRDDARAYSGIGIRLGIVPKLERFQY